ncbi:SIMPL domain-containing protein [Gracilimonas tropica]|uniref:SIMPL domain-containing protein n=1 Tax=Gracilimonas tropica TaxID=454600 RepID=UPI000364F50B|nr:SIMPL domain-containing protein [Gracilimonas tropica]
MKKLAILFSSLALISCTQEKSSSIKLGVDQTLKIPVEYVSVYAGVRLEDADPLEAEKGGFEKLASAVDLLKKLGYKRENLEINSGELQHLNYTQSRPYHYTSSIQFDIHELNKIDTIRRALLKEGVNTFRVMAYKNSKEDSLYNVAYEQAIRKAKLKAGQLIQNESVEIGEILGISERVYETLDMPAPLKTRQQAFAVSLDAELEISPIEPLFNKEYYTKPIEFSIEFALE